MTRQTAFDNCETETEHQKYPYSSRFNNAHQLHKSELRAAWPIRDAFPVICRRMWWVYPNQPTEVAAISWASCSPMAIPP